MLIISGKLAKNPEINKVDMNGQLSIMLENCIFATKNSEKIPINIIAWNREAKYIKDNFSEGAAIHVIATERLQKVKVNNCYYGICAFTVLRVIDFKLFKGISGMIYALVSRMCNCYDEIFASNVGLCAGLQPINECINLKDNIQKDDSSQKKEDIESKEEELEEELEEIVIQQQLEWSLSNPEELDFNFEVGFDGDSGYNPEDEWEGGREHEPSGYHVLDFSVVRKEDYHR